LYTTIPDNRIITVTDAAEEPYWKKKYNSLMNTYKPQHCRQDFTFTGSQEKVWKFLQKTPSGKLLIL
jgi:hypothetical protein